MSKMEKGKLEQDILIDNLQEALKRQHQQHQMYEAQLQMGCRCLEIDCWDGVDGEPDVKHGRTMTSAIKFKDVIESIAKYAFVASPYPVVLSLEMHCSLPQQEKMAAMMIEIFGSKLARPEECASGGRGDNQGTHIYPFLDPKLVVESILRFPEPQNLTP